MRTFFSIFISSLHYVTDGTMLGISYPLPQRKAMLAAHRAIYEQLEAHDPEGAEAAMRSHMGEYHRYLERRYPEIAASGSIAGSPSVR